MNSAKLTLPRRATSAMIGFTDARLALRGRLDAVQSLSLRNARSSPRNWFEELVNRAVEHSGLIDARRQSRMIIYTANYEALGGLVRFLMEDCCSGHPEICAPAAEVAACCAPLPKENLQ